jgi:hypothetical protein
MCSPEIARAMSRRCISDVPSNMVKIIASRYHRSTGCSRTWPARLNGLLAHPYGGFPATASPRAHPTRALPAGHLPDEIVDPLFNLKLILVEIETIDHRACLPMPDFPPVAGLRPFFG